MYFCDERGRNIATAEHDRDIDSQRSPGLFLELRDGRVSIFDIRQNPFGMSVIDFTCFR